MQAITSRANPLIQKIVTLHKSSERKKRGLCIAEGLRTCSTLNQNLKLVHLFITEQNQTIANEQFDHTKSIPVTDHVMEKLSTTKTPSGFLGVFEIPKTPDPSTLTPGLVCAQITDPGNMGTLIRTSAALGITSVVIVEGCDPWNPKVISASAGTIGMVSLFEWSWDELVKQSQNKKSPLCALTVSGGAAPEVSLLAKSLLVVGNEAHGLPQEWEQMCTSRVTLSMPGKTESLNAAVAGSIALYMAYRKI